MAEVIDQQAREAPADTDLVAAIQRVLAASEEPLTLSKIRAALPGNFRRIALEELAETLRRQVAANVLQQYPKYRSQQDRFWDRPMPVHVASLLRTALEEGPLAWPQLRRKLPGYAVAQAEVVLQEQIAQGTLHRHPPAGSRSGERFGVAPPDPRDYLRNELATLFRRQQQAFGFTEPQLREAAMAVLQEEEWGTAPESGEPRSRRDRADERRQPSTGANQPAETEAPERQSDEPSAREPASAGNAPTPGPGVSIP
jgi:hypothetical protein